ncbi:IMPACT family protein [Algoriphagus litoralis]|uniref:IMPACT family protein n=1 Tax=Algoriphagus litoralis TaxID=2202829 RepID=UPI001E5494DF|nr:YigZ family protein [Algoriphagus litoralis]
MINLPSEKPAYHDSYLTVSGISEGVYKDRGSKFHYFCYPVSSEEEIKTVLGSLRKTFFDASHHCFAWVLGKEGLTFRANDDGEPNHSAGDPILGQIRSHQLTNVLIVVVRYFGGTKLGVSGLIQAYKTSAAMAIEENEIVEEWVMVKLALQFPYPAMNAVMKVVKSQNLVIIAQEMNLDCNITLSVRQGLAEQVLEKLGEIEAVSIRID